MSPAILLVCRRPFGLRFAGTDAAGREPRAAPAPAKAPANPKGRARDVARRIVLELERGQGPEERRELRPVRQAGPLRRHGVPPRHPRLHDPGRRLLRRHEAEADPAPIPNEADNGLRNAPRHGVAMARTTDPHRATAQFFVNRSTTRSLNHTGKSAQRLGLRGVRQGGQGMDMV